MCDRLGVDAAPNDYNADLPTQAWRAGTVIQYVPTLGSNDDPCVETSRLLLVWNV